MRVSQRTGGAATLVAILHLACSPGGAGDAGLGHPLDAGDAGDAGTDGGDAGVPLDAGNDLPTLAQLSPLTDPILDGGWVFGMVIGLIDPTGQQVYTFGTAYNDGGSPTSDTIFECASVTKTITALWIASGLDAGSQLDDPVADYLPSGWVMPADGGSAITLAELGAHTSGLPGGPLNNQGADPGNPFGAYSATQMEQCLANYSLTEAPGTSFLYSNLGAALLGDVWAQSRGTDYETALVDFLAPLGLSDTVFALSGNQATRFADGHDPDLNPVEHWTYSTTLAPAGGVRSTVTDLLHLLSLQIGLADGGLSAAVAITELPRFGLTNFVTEVYPTFGLFKTTDGAFEHGGYEGGFSSFIGYSPTTQQGVVVLINTAFANHDLLGLALLHLLRGQPVSSVVPPTLWLTPAQLAPFTGAFQLTSGSQATWTFSEDGGVLWAQAAGPVFRLYADSQSSFYTRSNAVPTVGFAFQQGTSGTYDQVVIAQGTFQGTAVRLGDGG